MKNIIHKIAALAAKTVQRATKAIRAGVDSWNTTDVRKEPSEMERLGMAIYYLSKEASIKGTLTQRTATALSPADEYVSARRARRVWGYLLEAKAVECLTALDLRDIVQVIKHCEVDTTSQSRKAENEQLRNDLMELAVRKDGMKLEEAIAFGQSAAEELLLRRFRAETSAATNNN